uniref:Putative secreted protein n=1 Tax=Ixodes ricinus TaxID=34613 RepID=V5IDD2_IXORI
MVGTRRLLLVATMAYVLLLTQVLAGSADVDSAIQRASSGDGKVGGVEPTGTSGKPVASNGTVPVPTTQSLAAGNGSNGTGAATVCT